MIHENGDPVRQHYFQKIAPQHEQQPFPHIRKAELVRNRELLKKIFGPLDRPGHQLREERHEQRVPEEILLGINLAPVHIHGVAQRLKCVKLNPHRKHDVKDRNIQAYVRNGQSSRRQPEHKIEIFIIE